jgi:hypothetical protein
VTAGKRRRGQPSGSKNKPKPPSVVMHGVEPTAAMRSHMLEGGRRQRRGADGVPAAAGVGVDARESMDREPAAAGVGAGDGGGRRGVFLSPH